MKNRILKSGLLTLSVCLAFLLFAGSALAMMIKMSVAELTNEANTIVRGTVLDLRSHWNREGTRIVTDVAISAQGYIKGHEGGEIIIQVPGGTVGELGEWVEDVPTFEKGQDVILFLGDNEYFRVVGWHQGKFTVEKDMVLEIGLPVDTFMTGIRQTMAGSAPQWAVEKFPEVSTQGDIGALTLNSINPTSGPAHADELGGTGCASDSTSVTFSGSGWPSSQGVSDYALFYYQGSQWVAGCVDSWSSTQIVARVPARASSGNVYIYLDGGATVDGPQSFEVTYSYGGGKWPSGSYPQPMSEVYLINENTSDCTGEGAAVQAADTTWDNVASADFYFRYGGATSVAAAAADDENSVLWRDLGSSGPIAACTTRWLMADPHMIVEFDIEFNDYHTWSTTGAGGTYDVQSIATHELGHALTLKDLYGSADSEKTMYGVGFTGETKLRTLEPEDMAGIAYIYPGSGNNPPNAPSSPSPVNGATGVSINADLSWTGGDPDPSDTVTYDVYFEANDTTPDTLLCNDAATTTCDPGALAYNTHYYWYVVATDNHSASTTGATWDFTTMSAPSSLDCTGAVTVQGGGSYNGDTTGSSSNVNFYSCVGWNESGPEDVYVMTTSSTGDIVATLSNMTVDLDVFILSSCNENACQAYSDTEATYSNAPPGTYYIVVDGYYGAAGSYTLSVTGNTGGGNNIYLPIILKNSP